MPKITIDGRTIEVESGTTVLQAARSLETEIPVFCYHERLDVAGNCRMCLVEQENAPKPIASCAMPVMDGMVIHTNTEKVRKAREGVLEFLLMNHPLDCPICDQGGECDLQDITMSYGRGESRYDYAKRAVPEKYMGPLIKTFMTRCIHCTRCVRFADRVGGKAELGGIARGENAEITTYLDASVKTELSGNLVDICPVGALTSRPYSYQGRPWELRKTNSIDVHDAVGSNISVQTFGMKVRRILPRLHEGINEEWISDKTRHACDALALQRLDRPYIREKGKLRPATFEEAFAKISEKLKGSDGSKIAALAGDLADCEAMIALKDLMLGLGSPHFDCVLEGAALSTKTRGQYLFNTPIADLEKTDFALIIGANIRADASMVHTRLRKRYLEGGFKAAYLGGVLDSDRDFTFAYDDLGNDVTVLEAILAGKHSISKALKKAKSPVIIVGYDALKRADGPAILTKASEIAESYGMIREEWNGFNILHKAASRVGGLDVGFIPQAGGMTKDKIESACENGDITFLYLLGVDNEICPTKTKSAFKVYQGHHGDLGAHNADVILPGAAYTEKDATYVNLEGRVQQTYLALNPPGEAKEDWRILRALSAVVLDNPLPYDTLAQVRERLQEVNPIFKTLDEIVPAQWKPITSKAALKTTKFAPSPFDFYRTNVIAGTSPTMAKCVQELCRPSTLTQEKIGA
ncbi:MAG: NADH-quinone oxidoreductase subunit G [Alphaproteobacteria bacterium]|nr:NADH-quinone oxidoreductase subunit G [Alphaproteobacteria bacterium]NCQ67051.1 NADH-quinone oxidoreductase subunit G [Alphaproteobacteria bacterium]NCT07648.1 NADH-quinone oxidoreductase subunit G [Alphaproteobacteria bacterium]